MNYLIIIVFIIKMNFKNYRNILRAKRERIKEVFYETTKKEKEERN